MRYLLVLLLAGCASVPSEPAAPVPLTTIETQALMQRMDSYRSTINLLADKVIQQNARIEKLLSATNCT